MRGLVLIAGALGSLAFAGQAFAASITVDENDDNGAGPGCELREAISSANTNSAVDGCTAGAPGGDVIGFSLATPATISLAVSTPPAAPAGEHLTLTGPTSDPADLTIVQTSLNHRIIEAASIVTVVGITFTDGNITTSGGAIRSTSAVFATDAAFVDNSTGENGGCISGASVSVTESTFTGNAATLNGGCISGGEVIVTDSTFKGNHATVGGAVTATDSLDVTDSTFGGPTPADGNVASSGGGAIGWDSTPIDSDITGSTFQSNRVTGNGGGGALYNGAGASMSVARSTFTSNNTTGAAAEGGAISSPLGSLSVDASTFFQNGSANAGGAVHLGPGSAGSLIESSTFRANNSTVNGGSVASEGSVTLRSDTFADNTSPTGDVVHSDVDPNDVTLERSIVVDSVVDAIDTNCSGSIVDGGRNVIFGDIAGSTCPTGGTNVVGNPNLRPISAYGGPTSTMLPGSPSAAVDIIPLGSCLSEDQRGATRPVPSGGTCDAGAVEVDLLPDGRIGEEGGASPEGDDIYNDDGDGQSRTLKVKAGKKAKFAYEVESDAQLIADDLIVTGPGSNSKFTVKYKDGSNDVTGDVTGAGYAFTSVPPGVVRGLGVSVKPKKSLRSGKRTLAIEVTSAEFDGRSDTVLAKATVK